ncbi:MAG: DUF4058 family protein [Cyanobacteria bacterium J06635_1]
MPDVIPTFALPLLDNEIGPQVDLKSLLDDIYDQSGYDLVIDYRKPPIPELSEADSVWVEDWLRQKGLRSSDRMLAVKGHGFRPVGTLALLPLGVGEG